MKKTLLALALLAFTGTTAFAHDGGNDKDGKKGKKKEACSAEAKSHCSGGAAASLGSTPSCCMKKGTKAEATTTDAKTPVKAL